jgi:hypothetical protein
MKRAKEWRFHWSIEVKKAGSKVKTSNQKWNNIVIINSAKMANFLLYIRCMPSFVHEEAFLNAQITSSPLGESIIPSSIISTRSAQFRQFPRCFFCIKDEKRKVVIVRSRTKECIKHVNRAFAWPFIHCDYIANERPFTQHVCRCTRAVAASSFEREGAQFILFTEEK